MGTSKLALGMGYHLYHRFSSVWGLVTRWLSASSLSSFGAWRAPEVAPTRPNYRQMYCNKKHATIAHEPKALLGARLCPQRIRPFHCAKSTRSPDVDRSNAPYHGSAPPKSSDPHGRIARNLLLKNTQLTAPVLSVVCTRLTIIIVT